MYRKLLLICSLWLISTIVWPTQAQVEPIPQTVQCGDVVEGVFSKNQDVRAYSMAMMSGETIDARATAFGEALRMALSIHSPTGDVVVNSVGNLRSAHNLTGWGDVSSSPTANTGILSATGSYTIQVASATSNGAGDYTLHIKCKDRNGNDKISGDSNKITPELPPEIPDFGFPGVASRDFSAGIELPLTLAQPQNAPVASDVALYTYNATANETRTLKISRVSGDISIGVSVINKDTNEIVFFGGMPSSNSLSVELTFPSEGTYAIGLFRVDTAEKTGTSGAVQITLE